MRATTVCALVLLAVGSEVFAPATRLPAVTRLPALCSPSKLRTTISRHHSTTIVAQAAAAAGDESPQKGLARLLPPRKELKKVLPLGLMFFFILFDYTILRDTKDVLVVTAPKSGAEIIPFLKTYVNLPGAIGFTVLYSKMTNKFSRDTVFYSVVSSFVAFFALFAFVIYPCQGYLHPHAFADWLAALLPAGMYRSSKGTTAPNATFCVTVPRGMFHPPATYQLGSACSVTEAKLGSASADAPGQCSDRETLPAATKSAPDSGNAHSPMPEIALGGPHTWLPPAAFCLCSAAFI